MEVRQHVPLGRTGLMVGRLGIASGFGVPEPGGSEGTAMGNRGDKELDSGMERMMKRVALLTLALAVLLSSPALGLDRKTANRHAHQLDELMTRLHEYEIFNGSILVAEENQVIYKKGFGHANMEWEIPNEPDTRFRIGSITKPFTSILVFQLIEEGKLRLDGHISDYLPDYPKPAGETVTIRHLLTHRSGIPNYLRDIPEFRSQRMGLQCRTYEPAQFVEIFSERDLRFEPGSQFEYCNSGYYLLGAITEEVTGKSYEENLQERILLPLGMEGTGYVQPGVLVPKRAFGYYETFGDYRNADYMNPTVFYSAGGMYSTVEDLYLLDQALYTETLLSEEMKKQMFELQFHNERTGSRYAYGWVIGRLPIEGVDEPFKFVGHAGDNPGFFGVIARAREDRDFIVFLTNTNAINVGSMRPILGALTAILHDLPYDMPKRSIARAVGRAMESDGAQSVVRTYWRCRRETPDEYDFAESELNQLGYHFMRSGRIKDAVEIFKLNVEAYPEAANPYDSLGEGYMNLGEKDKAIQNYRKSLELDPENQNAVEMLEKLTADE